MKVQLFAGQAAMNAGRGETLQLGKKLVATISDRATGQGENPAANLSAADVSVILMEAVKNGLSRDERAFLAALRGPASDDRSRTVMLVTETGEHIALSPTNGRNGGEAAAKVGSRPWMVAIGQLAAAAKRKTVEGPTVLDPKTDDSPYRSVAALETLAERYPAIAHLFAEAIAIDQSADGQEDPLLVWESLADILDNPAVGDERIDILTEFEQLAGFDVFYN